MLNIPTSKNGEALHIPLNNAALAALENVHQRGEKIGRVFQSEKTGEPLANSRTGLRTLYRLESRISSGMICGTVSQRSCG
jgi:hypothetical protein